jgi:phosphatidylserine/phosphatidylglycerophosphate/cardiolipin synthase-like enzyme
VRENEALHLESIRRAKRLIYLENQYFTSPVIAAALAERLAEPDGPEIVLVSTGRSPSWFDGLTMDTARAEVLYRLEQADRYNRFFAFSPRTLEGERIIVHAKMSIIDDRLLRIGSTNLNNRSQGLDTECDVAAEPTTETGREVVRRFRQRSIGHFIGVSGEDFAQAEAIMGSVGQAVLTFGSDRMTLLGSTPPSAVERMIAEWQLGDPASSMDAWRPWKRLNRSHRPRLTGSQAETQAGA